MQTATDQHERKTGGWEWRRVDWGTFKDSGRSVRGEKTGRGGRAGPQKTPRTVAPLCRTSDAIAIGGLPGSRRLERRWVRADRRFDYRGSQLSPRRTAARLGPSVVFLAVVKRMPTRRKLLTAGAALSAGCVARFVPAQKPAPLPTVPTSKPLARVAFGSCAQQTFPQPIWRSIAAARPELFLFLGDCVYARESGPESLRAAFRQLENQRDFSPFRSRVPVLATWDDHDYGLSDGGREHPQRAAAQQVFLDFLREPLDSPLRKQEGVFRSARIGPPDKRVQILMLDTRYHRSPLRPFPFARPGMYLPRSEPDATLLGPAQWKWLEGELRKPARWRLLVSSIQFIPLSHPFEKWGNLPRERTRLLRLLKDHKVGGVVVLSGDQHLAEVSRLAPETLGYPLYEFTSSGLTHDRGDLLAPNLHRVGRPLIARNFGLLEFDWQTPDPQLRVTLCDHTGKTRIQHRLRLSTLQPSG